jgi:hypothetical protein
MTVAKAASSCRLKLEWSANEPLSNSTTLLRFVPRGGTRLHLTENL